jgi:hypothetical protein
VRKFISGELLRIETDQHGVSFFPQNSQALRAFLPWEGAFQAAMEPTVPPKSGMGIRIVEVDEPREKPTEPWERLGRHRP